MDISCLCQPPDAMSSATPAASLGRIPKTVCCSEDVRPLGLTMKNGKQFLIESVVARQMQQKVTDSPSMGCPICPIWVTIYVENMSLSS